MTAIENSLLERFDHFNDAIITDISIDYKGHPGGKIVVKLNCEDDLDSHRRKECMIEFHQVLEFKVAQDYNTTLSVASFGILILETGGIVYVDFDPGGLESKSLEGIRRGNFYIGARDVEVSIVSVVRSSNAPM